MDSLSTTKKHFGHSRALVLAPKFNYTTQKILQGAYIFLKQKGPFAFVGSMGPKSYIEQLKHVFPKI